MTQPVRSAHSSRITSTTFLKSTSNPLHEITLLVLHPLRLHRRRTRAGSVRPRPRSHLNRQPIIPWNRNLLFSSRLSLGSWPPEPSTIAITPSAGCSPQLHTHRNGPRSGAFNVSVEFTATQPLRMHVATRTVPVLLPSSFALLFSLNP